MVVTMQNATNRHAWALTAQPRDLELWRCAAAGVVAEWGGGGGARHLARLVVSELLSNVIEHAGDPRCELALEREDEGFVRVLVYDSSLAVPVMLVPNWDAERGRGLWLVHTLAADWGYLCMPGGKAVWALVGLSEDGRGLS